MYFFKSEVPPIARPNSATDNLIKIAVENSMISAQGDADISLGLTKKWQKHFIGSNFVQ